ncbi:MAG: adenylate/guanylate cyclase domain-containing protein, partial [Chloroflexota bacterium]
MPELLDTLASYVPALITRRLAEDPALPTAPVGNRFPAAALFADITGFTRLAERLAQRGPSGAEELTRLLNHYFGRLIDLITADGGEIVKFAGDALLALWPATADDLPAAALRAAQCSLTIQSSLKGYETADGWVLYLRAAVGAGEVSTAQLGGVYGRWEYLVAGAPLAQTRLAQRQANPGDVTLSPEAWSLVSLRCAGQTLSGGIVRLDSVNDPLPSQPQPPPPLRPEMEPALRAYIPGAILARISAGQTAWLAELRRVTVLFVNLPDLNHTTPLDEAHAVTCALQNALYRFEGSINKLSVDDKGVTLVAAMGLPPLAHEDDAARGVQAALEIQNILRQLKLRSAIGVTTGRAFCGSVGSAARREYTMVGDVVNLAARLMQAAPGDILCDGATQQAAESRVTFDSLPPITVKGKTEPVSVYRPLSVSATRLRISDRSPSAVRDPKFRIEMVGRAAERIVLAEQTQLLLRGGQGGIVIVEGEAGIGKSRLVDHLRRQAEMMVVITLSGAGDAIERSTLYYAWRPIFTQLYNIEAAADPQARRDQIRELLPSEAALLQLAPLLNDVLPSLDFTESTVTKEMSGQVRADNTRELLVGSLQLAVARGPRLLILEDAHWLDASSWALALAVCRRVQPLLAVIATRPPSEPLPPQYEQLRPMPGLHH